MTHLEYFISLGGTIILSYCGDLFIADVSIGRNFIDNVSSESLDGLISLLREKSSQWEYLY